MNIVSYVVFASALLIAVPAFGVEIDCPPELEGAMSAQLTGVQRAEDVMLDDDLKQKRKKAREEDLARAKARFTQQVRASARPEPTEQSRPPQ